MRPIFHWWSDHGRAWRWNGSEAALVWYTIGRRSSSAGHTETDTVVKSQSDINTTEQQYSIVRTPLLIAGALKATLSSTYRPIKIELVWLLVQCPTAVLVYLVHTLMNVNHQACGVRNVQANHISSIPNIKQWRKLETGAYLI